MDTLRKCPNVCLSLCFLGDRLWGEDEQAGHLLRSMPLGSVQLTGREGAGLGRGSSCGAVWVGSSDPLGGSEVGVTL